MTMKLCARLSALASLVLFGGAASAWELAGTKSIALHARDGQQIEIGTLEVTREGSAYRYAMHLDHGRFKDFFLSMKEFKCLEGTEEIQCHVPYPYETPRTLGADDLRWLEHDLLFLFKAPKDFGAKLWNGLYYRMELTDDGIVGTPEAVDLNLIGAPPEDPSVPPFHVEDRSEIDPKSRWFSGLSIR